MSNPDSTAIWWNSIANHVWWIWSSIWVACIYFFSKSFLPCWSSGWCKPALLTFYICNIHVYRHFCHNRQTGATGNCVLRNGGVFLIIIKSEEESAAEKQALSPKRKLWTVWLNKLAYLSNWPVFKKFNHSVFLWVPVKMLLNRRNCL